MERTIIIGAGHGGSQCAVSLRSEGYEGEILLVDSDAAELPYHKPPLSKKFLLSDDQKAVPLRPESAYQKASVQRIHDVVVNIDVQAHTVHLQDIGDISFSKLVIATGAKNRELPALTGVSNVHSIRTLSDTQALRTDMASINDIDILGGGFIGLEVAACLAGMGKKVCVLEAAQRVLARVVSPDVSARVQQTLEQLGIEVVTGKMAVNFDVADERISAIELDSGDMIKTELLIVGIGATPNDNLAQDAGIDCQDGILVNSSLQTSADDIFALGDCARFNHWQTKISARLESVQNAVDQAKQIAHQIAQSTTQEFTPVPWFWSDIGPLKLQIAGVYNGDTEQVMREDDGKFALYHLQDNQVVCVETINNAKDHMVARKLIGSGVSISRDDILAGPDALKACMQKSD